MFDPEVSNFFGWIGSDFPRMTDFLIVSEKWMQFVPPFSEAGLFQCAHGGYLNPSEYP